MKIYSKDKKKIKMKEMNKWIHTMNSCNHITVWRYEKSKFNYSKILDVIKWQKNCCHRINMIQWNYLLKTIGNKKMKISIIITCFSEEQKYKSTRVQRYKRNRRDRIDRSNKELQIQGIRFDETTKTYQQFENGPRVIWFSLWNS